MTTIHSEKYSDRSISAGSEADGVIPLAVPRKPKRKTTVIRVLLWTLLGFAILALSRTPAIMAPIYSNLKSVLTLGLYFGLRTRNAAHTPVKTPGNTVAGIDTYINGPVIETNFADPCLFELDGTFHAFATNRYVKPRPGQINIQYAISKNFDDWNLTDVDALPNAGPWASGDHVWAPDVVQLVCLLSPSNPFDMSAGYELFYRTTAASSCTTPHDMPQKRGITAWEQPHRKRSKDHTNPSRSP